MKKQVLILLTAAALMISGSAAGAAGDEVGKTYSIVEEPAGDDSVERMEESDEAGLEGEPYGNETGDGDQGGNGGELLWDEDPEQDGDDADVPERKTTPGEKTFTLRKKYEREYEDLPGWDDGSVAENAYIKLEADIIDSDDDVDSWAYWDDYEKCDWLYNGLSIGNEIENGAWFGENMDVRNCYAYVSLPGYYTCVVTDRWGNQDSLEFIVRGYGDLGFRTANGDETGEITCYKGDTVTLKAVAPEGSTKDYHYVWENWDTKEICGYMQDLTLKASEYAMYVCYIDDGDVLHRQRIAYYVSALDWIQASCKDGISNLTVRPDEKLVLSVDVEGSDLSDLRYEWSACEYDPDTGALEYVKLSDEVQLEVKRLERKTEYVCVVRCDVGYAILEDQTFFTVTVENHLAMKAPEGMTQESSSDSDSYYFNRDVCAGSKLTFPVLFTGDDLSDLVITLEGEDISGKESGFEVTVDVDEDSYIWVTIEDRFGNRIWGCYELNRVYKHSWSDWTTTKAPTSDDCIKARTCSRCGAQEEGSVGVQLQLIKADDGKWYAYSDDTFREDFTGIASYDGGEFFVADGVVCTEANGLNLFDGKWYFLANGQIQRGYNGFAEYDNHWFMIEDGELVIDANGLFDYDGGTFVFAAGMLQDTANGLWYNAGPWDGADYEWYFLANGQVQKQYEGVTEYDGEFFKIKDGKLGKGFDTGEYGGQRFVFYDGRRWAYYYGAFEDSNSVFYEVEDGRIVGLYSGVAWDRVSGLYYEIKDGKLVRPYTGTYDDGHYVWELVNGK